MGVYALEGTRPQLPASGNYWIADTAAVIGDVVMKEHTSVWFGAVLRGDTETITLGNNSNVQDNSVCHADPGCPLVIGDNVTVGHKAILHGCVIGDNTLIGMGATIMNRAKVGKNCVVGAGALIGEDKEIPDNSLVVGVPGRVVRTLNEAQIEAVKKSADIYVKNHQRFRAGLEKIS